MRKTSIILLISAALVLSMLTQVESVHAVSCGYERQVSDHYEIYLEYLPIFAVDTSYPSASEEWAFKFYIKQRTIYDFFGGWGVYGWAVDVYFRDDDSQNNSWATWKRWYPLSTSQNGQQVSWSLSASIGPISLGTTISVPFCTSSIEANYTKVPANISDDGGKAYMRVSNLNVNYGMYWFSQIFTCEGAGSLGIPNDLAAKHLGNHIKMYLRFTLQWVDDWGDRKKEYAWFILGDDTPANTDCFIPVQQGTTTFTVADPYVPKPGTPAFHLRFPGGSRTCLMR